MHDQKKPKDGAMITLTRLSGSTFLLNADLIERVDATPDTVITLVDGKKYVVSESLQQVLDAVLAYRGEIQAIGSLLDAVHPYLTSRTAPRPEHPRLAAVTEHPTVRTQGKKPTGTGEA